MKKEKEEVPFAHRATHKGSLNIAGLEIECYVLDDGTRVLSRRGMMKALGLQLGSTRTGDDRLTSFLSQDRLKSLGDKDLAAMSIPFKFRTDRGSLADGSIATLLVDICEVVLDARKAGNLLPRQEHIADHCEILMRGFARVGIIALVDEATNYQEVRDRLALQKILEKYLLKEYGAWYKRFPNEFYEQLFRIKGWQWKEGSTQKPGITANYTNDLVYDRLAPGVKEEIKRRREEVEEDTGQRIHMHRWLTVDTGIPALDKHFTALLALMRATPDKNWGYLKRLVARALPKAGEQLPLETD